jgi:hypothetical protein
MNIAEMKQVVEIAVPVATLALGFWHEFRDPKEKTLVL